MNEFPPPLEGQAQDETRDFRPKFNADGLITAIAQDARTGEVLMLAHMNAAALMRTIETGKAHYFSRSRAAIWLKGETSGNLQHVEEIRIDCDQDAILLKVTQGGDAAACHTGRVSCFYRTVETGGDDITLAFDERPARFDPDAVYTDKT